MIHEMMRNLPDVDEPSEQSSQYQQQANDGYTEDTDGYSYDTSSAGTPQQTEAPADYSFIPEQWRPQQFANPDEELKFYREKYAGLFHHIQSDAFINTFLDNYRDQLSNTEKEVQDFRSLMQAFRSNPETFIAANMPQYAQAMGLKPILSDEEIDEAIDNSIAEEFGENWREIFDSADLTRRSSISSKIFRRRQDLERQYEQQNQQAEEQRKSFISKLSQGQQQPPAPEQQTEAIIDSLEEAYLNTFEPAGFSQDEFLEIVASAKQYTPDMVDIYRMTHYDDLVKEEREEAYEEGRRALLEELRSAGKLAAADFKLQPRTSNGDAPSRGKFLGMSINL